MLLKRQSIGILLAGAIAGLTMGGITAYWWLNEQRPLPPNLPFGSNDVPQDALMAVSLTTNPQQWQQLQRFGTPETQAWLTKTVEDWRDRLLTLGDYNYRQDIASWIGQEFTVVVLQQPKTSATPEDGAPPLPNAPQEQIYALLLPIADPVQADAMLNRLTVPGAENSRVYKGIQLRRIKGATDQWLAKLNDQTLVAAKDDAAIARIIDTAKGGNSVVTATYRQAFERIVAPAPFARIYVNAPVAKQVAIANSLKPIPLGGISPLQNNQGMAATVLLDADGLTLRGANWLPDNSKLRYKVSNNARPVAEILPNDTLVMLAGSDFSQFWQHYQQPDADQPENADNPSFLQRTLQTATGLNPNEELLPWMNGKFSVSVIPAGATGELGSASGAGFLFTVQTSDRDAADAALKKLDEAMKNRYGFRISDGKVNEQPVVNWTSRFGSTTITRGWLDNVAFVGTGAIAPKLLPEAEPSLAENALFRATAAKSLDDLNGHLFINLEQILSNRGRVPFPSFPPTGEAMLNSIQAIGLSTTIQNERMTRYELHVLLKHTAPAAAPRINTQPILPPETFTAPAYPSDR